MRIQSTEKGLRWMTRRVRYATQEELQGFVRRPIHPKMVELATKEIERRRKLEEARME